jgi:histidine triad (HIT) family protein
MTDDCVFCSIIDGDIPSRTVCENDTTLAFLDANPLSRGHTLVVPKAHHERLNDLPEDAATDVFATLHRVVDAAEAAVDADASTVAFNNGEAAGQEVPHVHGHVVPRFEGDGGGSTHTIVRNPPALSDADLDDIAAAIEENV